MSSDMVKVSIDGVEYDVTRGQNELRTGDGRRALLEWVETFPEAFSGYKFVDEPKPRARMTVKTLKALLAAAERTGELTDDSEVRVWTGWEGPEHLDAGAEIVDGYLLITQA